MFPRDISFLYNPLEPTGGADPAAAPSTSTPPPSQTQPASTPPAATSTSTVTQASAGAAAAGGQPQVTQTPAAPAQPSWLDNFRKGGFDAKDEADAQTRLLQAYRDAERLRPLAPVLSEYQQNAQAYRAWQAEQQKQAQQQRAQEDWTAKLGWAPPQWDNAWRTQLTTDAQGNVVSVPGAPADLASKYQAYQHYRNTEASKMLDNPGKYMEPYIRHIAQEIAQQHAQQNVGQYQEKQDAQSFIKDHANWLYEPGQKVINPQTGRYEDALSNWGKFFVGKLQYAAQNGVAPEMQKEFALQAVQNAYLVSPEYQEYLTTRAQTTNQVPAAAVSGNAQVAQTPRQQANAAFNQRANPAAPPSPSSGGNAVPTPQKVDRTNLEQVMLQRFRDNGVTGIN